MKIPIPEYEKPPKGMVNKDAARLWREYGIYHSADADLCRTLLELWDGGLSDSLRDWLKETYKIRKEKADEAHEKSRRITMKAWQLENGNE